MKRTTGLIVAGMVAAICAFVCISGCETTQDASSALTVTLSADTITGAGATVTATASTEATATNTVVALPLKWSVSDSSLGYIKASSGMEAVYESTGKKGSNIITVRDQGDAEGMAVITQN